MTALILGLVVFLGVHSVRIVADGWRRTQLARLGGVCHVPAWLADWREAVLTMRNKA